MKFLGNNKLMFQLSAVLAIILVAVIYYGMNYGPATKYENMDVSEASVVNEETKDNLEDKVLVTFGDSVTEFGNYPEVISRNTNMKVHNVGFGGTRMAYHTNESYDAFSMTSITDAIVSGDFSEQEQANEETEYTDTFEELKNIDFEDVDYLTILYGTNDYMGSSLGSVPVGVEGDNTRETFVGSMNYIVDSLSVAYPDLEVIFISPTWRMNAESLGGGDASDTPNSSGVYLVDYVDSIIKFGESRDIPVLDLYRESGINAETKDTYLSDTVHPTPAGYQLIGETISEFLKEQYN